MSTLKVTKLQEGVQAPAKSIQPKLKALPLGDYEDNVVYSKFTLSEHYTKTVEPAGEAFEILLSKKLNPEAEKPFEEIMDDDVIEEDVEEYEWEKEYRSSKKFSSGFKAGKEENYYNLLGLEKEFINSTQEDIRKAYKKLALLHHPDKKETNSEEEKVEANKFWLKIKDAYETLTDPDKKYKYDSTFKFDDDIPSSEVVLKGEKDFFRTFGPVFLKNSIWSVRKPVPKLGDMATDLKKVKKFYNFWFSFATWRDFETEGEHNLDEAENRWEKRQMLKENKKLKATKLKDEKVRIRQLVELSYKLDPRIIAEEERVEKEKERIRQERLILREKLLKEKEEQEKRLQEEYEEKKRKLAEEQVRLRRELVERMFLTIKNDLCYDLSKDEIFQIELNTSIDNMTQVLKEIDAANNLDDKLKAFKTSASKFFGLKFTDDTKESSIWTKDEVYNLQRAVKKYPAGTVNRYEKIMEVVKSKGMNQIIQMTRYLATNPNLKFTGDTCDLKVLLYGAPEKKVEKEKPAEVKAEPQQTSGTVKETKEEVEQWSDTQQKALEQALKKYPGSLPANERWTKIAAEVPDKTKKQCVERFKYLAQLIKNK